MTDPQKDHIERIWREREERVYRDLFAGLREGAYALPADLFTSVLGQPAAEPHWLRHSVRVSPPHGDRDSWIYVTSGLSTPWWDDAPPPAPADTPSGMGMEFALELREESKWAVRILQWVMGLQLLIGGGHLKAKPIHHGAHVHAGGAIDGSADGALHSLLVTHHPDWPQRVELASGQVELLLCVGITPEEQAYGKTQGSASLAEKLQAAGQLPMTDPGRRSLF